MCPVTAAESRGCSRWSQRYKEWKVVLSTSFKKNPSGWSVSEIVLTFDLSLISSADVIAPKKIILPGAMGKTKILRRLVPAVSFESYFFITLFAERCTVFLSHMSGGARAVWLAWRGPGPKAPHIKTSHSESYSWDRPWIDTMPIPLVVKMGCGVCMKLSKLSTLCYILNLLPHYMDGTSHSAKKQSTTKACFLKFPPLYLCFFFFFYNTYWLLPKQGLLALRNENDMK